MVGWIKTKTFFETGDSAKSQGWTPIVVDTNGNGKRDEYVGPNDPVDPAKDKRVMAAFYGIMPSTVDDSVWGQTMGIGFARIDQPGYIVRLIPGANPAETSIAELFVPPDGAWSPRGIDMTTDGVVWTPLASGHIASFDRRKCKRPQNGPDAVTGKLCPEGWTLIRMPGPQFKGLDPSGSANHAYYVWVDRYNTLGLGNNVPIFTTNGSESLTAVVDGKVVDMRVPYPIGFFTQARRRAHRRCRRPAGRARACGRCRARAPCSTTKAARRTARRSTTCRSGRTRWRIDGSAASELIEIHGGKTGNNPVFSLPVLGRKQ